METLSSTIKVIEEWLSSDAVTVVKEKVGETVEVLIRLSQRHKLVLVGTGAVVGLYWYATSRHGFFKTLGIPGPKPGFLGVLSDYRKKGITTFDKDIVKEYGKVIGIFHGRQPVYLISDVDILKSMFVKEFPTFVNRNVKNQMPRDKIFGHSVLMAEDDHWKFLRSILSPTFTSGRMREMSPLIQKCVDRLVTNMWKVSEEGKKNIVMKDLFGMFTMDTIASTSFGIDIDCQNDPDNAFFRHAKKVMTPGPRVFFIFFIVSLFPFLVPIMQKLGLRTMDKGASDFFMQAVRDVVQHREEQEVPRTDLLQLMLNSHKLEMDKEDFDPDTHVEFDKEKRRGLTNEEIVGNAITFLLAGYETTSLAMSYVAYNLATNPECQEKLIAEIDKKLAGKPLDYDSVSTLQYLDNVFLETLRIFAIAVRIARTASEDIWIKGVHIKTGVDVHIPVSALHHDPEIWSEPEKFEPERFLPENRPKDYNYVYMPFGQGPRNCIGMRLAQMEAKMAIAGILQKYRFKTAPETKIPPEMSKSQNKPVDGIVLMIEKR